MSEHDPHPSEAPTPPAGDARERRANGSILLVATEELAGAAVATVVGELRRSGNGEPAVHVVAPVLATSALKHQANDIDDAIGPTRERLAGSLRELRRAGLRADGAIGDSDPLMAIKDELLKHDVDRILLVTHEDAKEAAYAEKELLDRVRREVEPPATELRVAGHDADERVVGRDTADAGKTRGREGHQFSANLPPMRSLDTAGLFVAIVGTLVLIVLAGACAVEESTPVSGACAFRFLLAGGFFLINIAHIVGLLLMSSVNYHGPFQRYMARLSLFGTPAAIVASLLVV